MKPKSQFRMSEIEKSAKYAMEHAAASRLNTAMTALVVAAFLVARRLHMRRWLYGLACPMALLYGCAEQGPPPIAPADFGAVAIYRPHSAPKGLALMLSDHAGWTPALSALGDKLAAMDYLVAGVDSRPYLKRIARDRRPCVPLADDLDNLAQYLQRQHGPPDSAVPLRPPVLAGVGQGATMVYVAATQAPADRFHAAISLDFCPRLAIRATFCAADGFEVGAKPKSKAVEVAPRPHLDTPWFIFQNHDYPRCPLKAVNTFADAVDNARLVELPSDRQPNGAGKNKEAPFIGLMQWLDPRLPHQAQSSTALPGLPLIEAPAPNDNDDYLAVLLTGDGGWAAFDKGIAAALAAHRISTVGWDSMAYYWKPRTPDQAAADLARILRYYLAAWQKQRFLLIGYSFGANVLPFLVNRLPVDLRDRVDEITLLGLAQATAFEFRLTEWLGATTAQTYAIAPEISRLGSPPILCVFGEDEAGSLCPALPPPIHVRKVPGDHHFNHDYAALVSYIVELAPALSSDRRPPSGVSK
jgi:type IV secretory pathway VirJ component